MLVLTFELFKRCNFLLLVLFFVKVNLYPQVSVYLCQNMDLMELHFAKIHDNDYRYKNLVVQNA